MTVSNPAAPGMDQATADLSYAGIDFQMGGLGPGLVGPAHPFLLAAGTQAIGSNTARSARVVVPKTGTLHDLYTLVQAASGNVLGAVYKVGSPHTLLWKGASIAAVNGVLNLGDPALAVTKGDILELMIAADNATVTVARPSATVTSFPMPSGFLPAPGSVAAKLAASITLGSFDFPATIADGSVSVSTTLPCLFARVS